MRILHVSDLHATPSMEKDQRLLVDALLDDVRRLQEDVPFDLVGFTGDLTYGGKAEEFALAESLLLQPLLAATELTPEHVVLTVGNHDVDRDRIDRIAEEGLRHVLGCRNAVNELLDDEAGTRRHTARLDEARRFLGRWYEAQPPTDLVGVGHFHVRTIGGRDVGLAALNSAWRATGAEADGDRGKLLVGDRQSKGAVELATGTAFNVALVHHPFDWLRDFDEDDVRPDIERHFDLVLTGHTHVPDPEQVASRRGRTVYSRAGCLYEHRDHPNGYSVVDVGEDGSVTVSVRTWWPTRRAFDAATDVAEDGRLVFPSPAAQAPVPVTRATADTVRYNAVLGGLVELVQQGSVIGDHLAQLEARDLGDLLVAPRLLEVPYEMAVAMDERRPVAFVDPLDVLDAGRCLVLNGDTESGVTTSLLWLLKKRYDVDDDRLPAYVRFDDIGPGRDPTTTAIRESLSRFGHAFGRTDPLPAVVVAVDDVHLGDAKRLDRLLRHIAAHPENLYVLGCHGDAKPLLDGVAAAGVEARPAFLGPFGRRELRSLIDRIGTTRHPGLADEILGLLLKENLPRTPFMMAVFVTVLSADGTVGDRVSEATALERYVKLILDRPHPSDSTVHRFDARIYEHILGSLARRLVEQGRDHLSRLDTERFLGDYFAGLGWEGSPGQVVDALVLRRILVDTAGQVGFRHPALHDLFAAKHMLEDDGFAKLVLEDPFEHEAVVRYAAALKRSDAGLLLTVGDAARRVLAQVRDVIDIHTFERMGEQLHGWSEGLPLDDLAVLVRPLDEEDLDRRLDRAWDRIEASEAKEPAGPTSATEGESGDGPADVHEAFPLFMPAVDLLSEVLRHSELVDDVGLKQRLLVEALEGWAHLGVAYAAYEDKTGSARELFEYYFDDIGPREHDRILRIFVVAVVAGWAAGSLGSSKVVGMLRNALDDEAFRERTANALFATLLYCDLRGPGWLDRLEDLYREHGRHPVVAEYVLAFSRYTYHHSSPANVDAAGLERVMVKVILDELKLTGLQAGRAKSTLLEELREGRRQALRRSRRTEADPYFSRDLDIGED